MRKLSTEEKIISQLASIKSAIQDLGTILTSKNRPDTWVKEHMKGVKEERKEQREQQEIQSLQSQNLLIKKQNRLLLITLIVTALAALASLFLEVIKLIQ